MHAVFFEDDQARATVERLRQVGFEASLRRERLAGEDDDEDQHWVVATDAPEVVLELLVEEYDGWLEAEGPAEPAAPLDLPAAPRRLKRDR